MGGFFGVVGKCDVMSDTFFGTDYHSHLGTRRAGMAAYNKTDGLQRKIHSIQNSPFRTKFDNIFNELSGTSAIGCISDVEPQPLLIRSKFGSFAICFIGVINNAEVLIDRYLHETGGHFDAMTGGKVNPVELVASMLTMKDSIVEGIKFVQSEIEGTATIIILQDDGSILAARDKVGRLPVLVGRNDSGHCVSFESFAYEKMGYVGVKELGPGEIVKITADSVEQLVAPGKEMKMCSFLWSYYGYPTTTYEGVNVEVMRYRNGEIMAERDEKTGYGKDVDYICGVPDSGTPHAIGYANRSHKPFARAFIKYTPTWARSFTPSRQQERNRVAKMKMIPVPELVKDKNLLFVDDSIVRGTQIRETIDFLYENGAKEVHMRSACPPIMYSCKYLNFSRATSEMELAARRAIVKLEGEEGLNHIDEYSDPETERGKNLRRSLCKELKLKSLDFQTLDGVIKAIGIDKCKLCTYCWNGEE
ncbi:MAG: amidophosphoribosyltransferase [Ruminococcaceae bacterium]|nr:amidophosphoribosyltransferase [Oscillospiraceae bacterium]